MVTGWTVEENLQKSLLVLMSKERDDKYNEHKNKIYLTRRTETIEVDHAIMSAYYKLSTTERLLLKVDRENLNI